MADGGETGVGEDYRYDLFAELFGALNEAPEADHARILKSFLVNAIDTMREHSVYQLDLLEKLAAIALNNVQDVRLYSLEARVKEIEQGKPVTFGEIVGEIFFAIVVEAAILGSVTYAAPALAGIGALVLTSIKTSARSQVFTRRVSAVMKKLEAIDYRRSELVVQDMRLMSRLHARTPKGRAGRKRKSWYRNRKVTLEELHSTRLEMDYLNRNREFYAQKAEDLSALAEVERYSPRYQSLYENAAQYKLTRKIEGLIDNYAHHVDAGKSVTRAFAATAAEKFPQAFAADDAQGGAAEDEAAAVYESFTTSHSVTQLIAQCESMKLDVILHYSQMRAIMNNVDDDEIFDAFETVLVMEEVENNLFDLIEVSETLLANLNDFVAPMELAIWLIYLESSNILERDRSPSNKLVSLGGYPPETTRFIGDDFVEEILQSTPGFPNITDSPRTTYAARSYPGLHALDEHQAYYLFHKFAKKAFALYADQIPVSRDKTLSNFIHRDVQNNAFAEVLSMQKVFFWSGENEERSNLIKEMGVVVIEYFNFVRERLIAMKTFGFSDAIPEGTAIASLLERIEKPTLAESEASPPPPTASPEEWLAEQQASHLAELEERTILERLAVFNLEYDRALDEYNHYFNTVQPKYLEILGQEQLNDFFLTAVEQQLSSVRSAAEGYIATVEEDAQGQRSDAIDEQVEQLKIKLMDCPVGKVMFSSFSR